MLAEYKTKGKYQNLFFGSIDNIITKIFKFLLWKTKEERTGLRACPSDRIPLVIPGRFQRYILHMEKEGNERSPLPHR